MTLSAAAPTHNPHPVASAAGAAKAAPAANPFQGKTRLVPFVVGIGLALALADTRAAPVVIAVLVGAIVFQLEHIASGKG